MQQGPQIVAKESTFPGTRESKTVLGRVLVLPGGSGGEAWAPIRPVGSILEAFWDAQAPPGTKGVVDLGSLLDLLLAKRGYFFR